MGRIKVSEFFLKNFGLSIVVVQSFFCGDGSSLLGQEITHLKERPFRRAHEKIIELIESVPIRLILPLVSDDEEDDKFVLGEAERLDSIIRELEKFSVVEVEDSIREILSSKENKNWKIRSETHEKIFLVTKALFDLPETVDRRSPHFNILVMGTGIPTNRAEEFNASDDDFVFGNWPFSSKTPKHFVPERRIVRTSYLRYRPLETFDYFRKNFKYLGAPKSSTKIEDSDSTLDNDDEKSSRDDEGERWHQDD